MESKGVSATPASHFAATRFNHSPQSLSHFTLRSCHAPCKECLHDPLTPHGTFRHRQGSGRCDLMPGASTCLRSSELVPRLARNAHFNNARPSAPKIKLTSMLLFCCLPVMTKSPTHRSIVLLALIPFGLPSPACPEDSHTCGVSASRLP